jgi:hypothetical protein
LDRPISRAPKRVACSCGVTRARPRPLCRSSSTRVLPPPLFSPSSACSCALAHISPHAIAELASDPRIINEARKTLQTSAGQIEVNAQRLRSAAGAAVVFADLRVASYKQRTHKKVHRISNSPLGHPLEPMPAPTNSPTPPPAPATPSTAATASSAAPAGTPGSAPAPAAAAAQQPKPFA